MSMTLAVKHFLAAYNYRPDKIVVNMSVPDVEPSTINVSDKERVRELHDTT